MEREARSKEQLEQRRDSLSRGIGRINDIYLSDRIRIGQVEIGSSFENTIEIGRTKSAAKKAIVGLSNKLEQVNSELKVNDEAKTYLNDLNLKRNQLAEMSELVAGGNLPEDILQQHQQEFEELQKLPENNPLLKRAIERIRQEEEEKKKQEEKPLIEILPDGKVRLPKGQEVGGKVGELLGIVSEGSEHDLKKTDWIVGKMHPEVKYKTGLKRVEMSIYVARRKLIGSGVELVGISDPVSRAHGEKGGYYLKQTERPDQAAQSGFQFEDGEVVTGEEGKLIKKLSPFSGNHIVAKQELLQEVSTDNVQVNEQDFNQRVQETRGILLHKSFRLAELPNIKEPENVGYYVEPYRPPVRITLLGDTVRYRDEENQDKQIRLSEKQYSLLWTLAKGEPKLDSDESVKTVAESLNKNLAELTGVDGIVVPVGNENFGYWHKIKDANIARRILHFPLRPTRQDTLKLIFQEDPATSRQDVINTLGLTSGRRQKPHKLNENQAWMALRRAIYSLKYRNIENITTEDEAVLYQEMQEYITGHNLGDEKGLIAYTANRLGFAGRPSISESAADAIDVTGADSLGDNEEIDVDDVDEVDREIKEEEGDSGVATLPRMTSEEEIETPEFGNLSKVDVALIAERLAIQRSNLEPFLGERGVRLIEQSALSEVADLVEGQEIGLEQQYLEGLMSADEFRNLMNEYRARAFEKAKEMLKDPNFGEIVDKIGDQNPNVWGLLVNLSEINEVIERSGHEEGISLIGKDSESLGAILSQAQTNNKESTVAEEKPEDGLVNTNEIPTNGVVVFPPEDTTEPKPSALERRDPEIRNILSQYMGSILEREGYNKPVSPAWVTRFAARIKERDMEHAVREGWVSPTSGSNGKHDLRYDAAAIATLLYLDDNSNQLNSRLKKQVQEIAEEEYRKRLKDRENNK